MNKPQPDSLLAIYRTAFENSRQGFCVVEKVATTTTSSPDFRYLLTNPAFEQQVDLQQVVGKTIRQLLPQTDNLILIEYDQVALTGRTAQFETYVATLDQWLSIEAFRVADFEPPWIGVLVTDITQRKRREADLAFLAEVSQDLALLTDIDQTMNALGQKIAAYLGLSASAFAELYAGDQPGTLTAVLSHSWHRDDVPSLLATYRMEEFMTPEVMQLCLAGKAVVIRDVFEDPRTDGPQYAALHIGSFISMPLVREGQWRFLLIIYRTEPHDWSEDEIELTRELTTRIWTRLERARAEEALRLEARRKDEFMAMLGHELRNPLATITNTLLVLELTQGKDERMSYTKGIQMLTRHSGHLNRMVDDLLDMSRIRQGIVRLQREVVNLNQLLQLTIEGAQPLFRDQNRQLRLTLPDAPLYVNGDEARLAQVVMNLLTNGLKYTDPGGQVWVRLEQVDNQVILRVGDNGIGLTQEEQTSIFEVFVQGATSLDRPHGGLGLGLAVVNHLVEQHGGQIQAFSSGLGQGSEFVIHLPLLTDLASAVPTRQVDQLPTSGRVLVVDDNADFADTTARLLRSKGFDVYTRDTGAQGLAGAESLKPDALLLDIGMSYLDGYEVCRQIRAQPWGASMAILALTGYGLETDKQKAAQVGFDGHLLKPVNLSTLAEAVAEAIARKKSH